MRDALDYAPFYCEENVLRLVPSLGTGALAVLVTNGERCVAMRHQRAGGPGTGELLWDYHAFAMSRGDEWMAWDFDTTLGWPLPAGDYLRRSFVSRPEEGPLFRVMAAADYAREFRSDRSHMRREDGSWSAPPPPWPAADAAGGVRLAELLDPVRTGPGEMLTLVAMWGRFPLANPSATPPTRP